jgi:precorrin-2 dehydrogenase/sirohydrochlorin ferrochelatase
MATTTATYPHYPLFLNLVDRPVLMVGGGTVALRKVKALLECGARVRVVAKRALPDLCDLASAGRIELEERPYQRAQAATDTETALPSDCTGACLVFCATDDEALNRHVFADARAAGAFCNVVDVPALCDFYVPSQFNRGKLQIAISTGGASPTVAKEVRQDLEAHYDQSWESYLALLSEVRALALYEPSSAADLADRLEALDQDHKSFFETTCRLGLRERLAAGEQVSAEQVIGEAMARLRAGDEAGAR